MPSTIEHQAVGVRYIWTFNQDVESGTFWDGSPYVIAKPNLRLVSMTMQTASGTSEANTVVSDIELGWRGQPGFKGELYIHGLVKNPNASMDIGPDGEPRNGGNRHDCRSFGTFDKGWLRYNTVVDPVTKTRVKVPAPTNQASSYPSDFNLTKFMEMRQALKTDGVQLESGDSLLVAHSNFDINSTLGWNVSRNGGYPYQRTWSRSCVLSYGTLFVLASHPAGVFFRPPVIWPDEDRKNRPMYPVSMAIANLPGDSELVANPSRMSYDRVPVFPPDAFRTFAYAFPLGSGTTYSQRLPLYTAAGKADITAENAPSAYGAYYQNPLLQRLSSLYAQSATQANRIEALKVVVQWGIDAYGSIKSFGNTSSGAGQRPCAARPWSIVAGHFLGNPDMRMPESVMMRDTIRTEGYFNKYLTEVEEGEAEDGETATGPADKVYTIKDGVPQNRGKQFTTAQWRDWMYGNFQTVPGKKRRLARLTSLEAVCYFTVVDDPTNLILHHEYMGASHRRSFEGAGCEFSMTAHDEKIPLHRLETSGNSMTGNFAKMHWATGIPTELTGWGFSHDGKTSTFMHAYVQVTEGPGASNEMYRIIHVWGNMRDGNAGASTKPPYLGFGWILDRPWKNGTPDATSKIRLVTCTRENVGEPLYIIAPRLYQPMSADANLSPNTPYADICEDLLVRIYGWMHYIQLRTGQNPDLDADSTLAHAYIRKIVFTNPYNFTTYSTGYTLNGARQWEASVMNRWYGRPQSRDETAASIDWSGIPGILTWCGMAVGAPNRVSPDLNNDGKVDSTDLAMLLSRFGTEYSEFDLNNDGVIDAGDLAILQANWGSTDKE